MDSAPLSLSGSADASSILADSARERDTGIPRTVISMCLDHIIAFAVHALSLTTRGLCVSLQWHNVMSAQVRLIRDLRDRSDSSPYTTMDGCQVTARVDISRLCKKSKRLWAQVVYSQLAPLNEW